MDPVCGQVKHQGGFQFPAVFREGGPFQEIMGLYGEEVHDGDCGRGGHGHEKGVQMRLMLIGRQEEEILDAMVFPFREKLVESPVKGFPFNPSGASVTLLARVPHSVGEGGGQEDFASPRDFSSYPFHDESVGSQWQMRAVLDQCPDGKDEAGVSGQDPPDLRPGEVLQGP